MSFEVVAEEIIGTYESANNGAGPMWCYGSPTIVRDGSKVSASIPETGKDVPPLCNTRWQLFCREDGGRWERVQTSPRFDEREPCPMLRLPGGRILLSVNPARKVNWEGPKGEKGYVCEPHLLEFSAADPCREPVALRPRWDRDYEFTEHSYRGCAADHRTGDLLMFNQTRDPVSAGSGISPDHSQCWSYLDRTGEWSHRDLLRYPIRGCYQHVALRDRAAYVMAVSDIVEPNACWRAFKKEVTGREWDYEFRQLFFTWTPDITRVAFSPILTFAHRDETAGLLRNCDMWISPDGDAHTVYIDRNVWHPFMRDRFFPGLPTTVALKYCRISKGAVVERKTLVECVEDMAASRQPGAVTFREGNLLPTCAAVHATSPESAFLIYHVSGQRGAEQATGNYVVPLWPTSDAAPLKLDLQHPLPTFFTASERTGTEPSSIADLYGIGQDPHAVRYAQVRIS